jgi:UDP-N-acetylmuramoyl-L-alanyl-D-glutamate--2,6-diaminopimelate ligase
MWRVDSRTSIEWRSVNLDDLTRALAASETGARGAVEITDLAYDAERVSPGALFFCIPGSRVDGHDFAVQAIAAGAAALVVERPLELEVPQLLVEDARAAMAFAADRFFGEPTRSLEVAGVTGTNGKTTTAFLLRSVLAAADRSPGLVGTVEWVVGGTARPAPHTTPEAIDLQRLFREMLDAGDRSVVVEASSHGSVLHRLDRVRFDALVFTNLSQDHLDLHGTMEDYYQAKRRLFTGAQPPPAAVNVGDEHGRRLALELVESRRAPLVTFGITDAAEVRPDGLELGPHGSRFRAAGVDIETPLRGRFNVENVLGVIAAGILLDVDEQDIADGVRAMSCVPGRFEAVDEGQPFAVIVDYAHTPDSLDAVLQAARELGGDQLICVFGAGGDRDRGKRPVMGAVAVQRADHVIVTSDNPRSEDPLAIIQDVLQGAGTGVEIDPDRRSAIRRAVALARPGDVVVIAGKGHEQGQEIAGVVAPFDDFAIVRDALHDAGFVA